MEKNEKPEKTKVCAIFEPTYRSIVTLPTDEMKLRMFRALCDYAFDELEPEFGSEIDERILAALWEQFRVVFVQAAKRSKINSINVSKGGRPKKTDVTEGVNEENPENPTGTDTDTFSITIEEETASCDSDYVFQCLTDALGFESRTVFSDDLGTSIAELVAKTNMNNEDLYSYIKFVANYSAEHSPANRWSYFYSVIPTEEMYSTFIRKTNK